MFYHIFKGEKNRRRTPKKHSLLAEYPQRRVQVYMLSPSFINMHFYEHLNKKMTPCTFTNIIVKLT